MAQMKTIQEYLNAKAGFTGTPVKTHQQLINQLAGTTGKTLQEAANVKVGNNTGVLFTVQECASQL